MFESKISAEFGPKFEACTMCHFKPDHLGKNRRENFQSGILT